jgi:hypothetical protein
LNLPKNGFGESEQQESKSYANRLKVSLAIPHFKRLLLNARDASCKKQFDKHLSRKVSLSQSATEEYAGTNTNCVHEFELIVLRFSRWEYIRSIASHIVNFKCNLNQGIPAASPKPRQGVAMTITPTVLRGIFESWFRTSEFNSRVHRYYR